MYLIEYEELVKRQLGRLDNANRKIIIKKIERLRKNPRRKKNHLFKNFYELKHKGFRIYYAVYKGIIVINKITYDGIIKVGRIGNKKSQRRDIRTLKKESRRY